MITNATALYKALRDYRVEYGTPAATPECVAELIADTDPNDDPQRQGLDMLAAQTIRQLYDALSTIYGTASACVAQRAPSDDAIISDHIADIRRIAGEALDGEFGR
jgi:hypothetical protein